MIRLSLTDAGFIGRLARERALGHAETPEKIARIAAKMGVTRDRGEVLALEFGWPNANRLQEAAGELTRRLNETDEARVGESVGEDPSHPA